MTTVPPPTAPLLQALAQAPAAPVVMILAPPPAVAALAAGTPLEGVVAQSTPDPATNRTDVIIQTPNGDITLKLPAPLSAGAEVDLQIVRATPDQATVRLVAVDDQPAAQVLTQALAQLRSATPIPMPAGDPAFGQPATSPAPQPLSPGDAWTPKGPVALPQLGSFSAFVIAPTPPAATPGAPAPTLAPPAVAAAPVPAVQNFALILGGELAVRVVAVTPPNMQAAPAAVPAAAPMIAANVRGAPIALAASIPMSPLAPLAAQPAPLAQPGLAVPAAAPAAAGIAALPEAPVAAAPAPVTAPAVVIVGREGLAPPPPAPPMDVAAAPAQATLTGTVVAAGPNAPPVIATELGQIQLNLRANLPVGTRLVLEIGEQLLPQPGAPPPSLPSLTLPLTAPIANWPTLNEAVALLSRADPPAAAQLADVIPDGGPRTALALVAFVQAMRSGDARQWPGETNLRALERLGPRGTHLAAQLNDEVSALSTRARETGSEWRALPIPWNADGRIDRITLITRREGEAGDEGKKRTGAGGARFLITLDLSRLGPMQLDGMFRRAQKGFDMIIRTKAALPDAMRFDLSTIFAASTAAMGLKGGLAFQVVKTFPDPLARPETEKSGVWA